jgi:hypothetical protein
MPKRISIGVVAMWVAASSVGLAATGVERIRNKQVLVLEETLGPGESEGKFEPLPSMIVYMSGGVVEAKGASHKGDVREGETVFQATPASLKNAGGAALHFVRVGFLTAGSHETWGTTGLSPHYVLLVENQYGRAYDIKIPAQTKEPQHTHKDRVVVSLSGAQLEHILPDGKLQPSTLKTGEVVWRLGGTHIGHNLGHTDLWVIAVEPK